MQMKPRIVKVNLNRSFLLCDFVGPIDVLIKKLQQIQMEVEASGRGTNASFEAYNHYLQDDGIELSLICFRPETKEEQQYRLAKNKNKKEYNVSYRRETKQEKKVRELQMLKNLLVKYGKGVK